MSLKKILSYIPRITPGIGLISLAIRDWKTRKEKPFPYYNLRKKEDWKVLGKYTIQIGWLAFFVFKAGFAYKGAQGLINKINKSKETEKTQNIPENKLEKTINYYDIERDYQ